MIGRDGGGAGGNSSDAASDASECRSMLRECEMFQAVDEERLGDIASRMDRKVYGYKDVLLKQGEPSDKFFLLQGGEIRRQFVDDDEKNHTVEYAIKARSINSMRILAGDPVHSTVQCVSPSGCSVFVMQRRRFMDLLHEKPEIATQIAGGLCRELRNGSRKYATPLLEQEAEKEVNFPAVSIAAGIESYYRSALNASLNARLTGVRAEYFPNMHVQVPTRIAYVCGFKGLRTVIEARVRPDEYSSPNAVRLLAAIMPGVIMTPISSVLEASNAGHMNSESMATRWLRGAVPRCGREIIFGLGLNQMSDYFEERVEDGVFGHGTKNNKVLKNAVGSLLAGIVSGYLSHVPHNLSTYKLLEPHLSYGQLYRKFVDKSVPRIVEEEVTNWPAASRQVARYAFATLFPRGVMIRTTQIVGSFVILNGTINYLSPSFSTVSAPAAAPAPTPAPARRVSTPAQVQGQTMAATSTRK